MTANCLPVYAENFKYSTWSGNNKVRKLKVSSASLFVKSHCVLKCDMLKVPEAKLCHIQHIRDHREAGWAWSGLGSLYLITHNHSQASVCFKQAAKLSGKLITSAQNWQFIGPFPIGKAETDGDPVDSVGGIWNITHTRFMPEYHLISELAPSGYISWTTLPQKSSKGYVNIAPNLAWGDLMNSLGSTGITEWQGWAVNEIAVNADNTNVVARCVGVHTVYIDGFPVTGDVYHRDHFRFGISLNSDIHTVCVRARAKGALAFGCSFEVSEVAFEVHAPHFLPDFVDGRLFSGFIALPIANLHCCRWLRNIRVSLEESLESASFRIKSEKSEFAVAPGQIRPVRFELQTLSEEFILSSCSDLQLTIRVSTSEGSKSHQVVLRCRTLSQSFLFTFLDHDGSLQHAAAIAPADAGKGEAEICPVVLTLHGTTVPPQNQADSYKRMINGEFVFGFSNAWVLAPTRLVYLPVPVWKKKLLLRT